MRDYFHVNILNEGMIPWIFEQGPKFGYYISAGMYDLLARDPRIKIEVTTSELAEQRKREYLAKKQPKKEVVKPVETVEIKDEVKIEYTAPFVEVVENDADDDLIDAILEETPVEMMKIDIANAPDQQVDADGMAIYTEEQISRMGKKELKAILDTRGHAAGQRLVKNTDPFSPLYHDSVDDLREKVRKSQETF